MLLVADQERIARAAYKTAKRATQVTTLSVLLSLSCNSPQKPKDDKAVGSNAVAVSEYLATDSETSVEISPRQRRTFEMDLHADRYLDMSITNHDLRLAIKMGDGLKNTSVVYGADCVILA